MQHYFDIDIAKKYGVNAAILLQNLGHWIRRNEANEKNYFDGNYWTFNSRRAYRELFPYMSERQINTAFQKLIDDGLVITGNYNKVAYDRTLWYALTQKGKSILHFDIMENDKMSNGNGDNVKPIPNINTNDVSNINTNKNTIDYQGIVDLYNNICVSLPSVAKITEVRKKHIRSRLNNGYTVEDLKKVFIEAEKSDFLKGKNDKNWKATFDWLILENNLVKVLEGTYKNRESNQKEKKGNFDYLHENGSVTVL